MVFFRNGAVMRLLEDYIDIRDKVEKADPGAFLEVESYVDSIDGKTRAVARSSLRAAEVDRVDEITDEMLTMEAIQSSAAAMSGLPQT